MSEIRTRKLGEKIQEIIQISKSELKQIDSVVEKLKEDKYTKQTIQGKYKTPLIILRDKFKFPSKVAFQQGCVVINTNNRLGIRESIKVMFGTNKTKDQAEEEALKLSGMKFVKLGKEKEFAEQQYKQQTEKDDLLE